MAGSAEFANNSAELFAGEITKVFAYNRGIHTTYVFVFVYCVMTSTLSALLFFLLPSCQNSDMGSHGSSPPPSPLPCATIPPAFIHA